MSSGAEAENAAASPSAHLPPGKSVDARYVGIWQARTGRQILYHTSYPDGEFERWKLEKTGRVVTARGIQRVKSLVIPPACREDSRR